jgi:oligopeptide transport system permease protein
MATAAATPTTSLQDSAPRIARPAWPVSAKIGLCVIVAIMLACFGSLPWTLGTTLRHQSVDAASSTGTSRYKAGDPREARMPPSWIPLSDHDIPRANALASSNLVERVAGEHGLTPDQAIASTAPDVVREFRPHWPTVASPVWTFLGTDTLGRSLLARCLLGGGISLLIGLSAAGLSVVLGTLYGSIAAYAGGWTDAIMMRIVDVLYGLPYILLVVLFAVASDSVVDEYISRSGVRATWVVAQASHESIARGGDGSRAAGRRLLDSDPKLRAKLEHDARERPDLAPREISQATRSIFDILVLLFAIGGLSWLTMARVVRGQVLSLKTRPFVEAAHVMGAGWFRQFRKHLLPNLVGPIVVYAALAVPQAILQESFLSFLGIGVKPPLPSWGNLAGEGLAELNPYRSHWWLLVFPCVLLACTLLALNFVGEGLRERLDPRRSLAR